MTFVYDLLGKAADVLFIPFWGYVAICLRFWIKTRVADIQKKTKDELTKKYMEMLDKTVKVCVLATNQTYVKDLKETNSFNEEAKNTAFELTYNTVLAVLTDDAQKCISETVKDFNTYVTAKIEAQVGALKCLPINSVL